jgi:protein phosphatase
VEDGDVMLLASDGLTEMVEEGDLARILCSDEEPQQCVDRLIAEANAHGGLDNITAIVVRPTR